MSLDTAISLGIDAAFRAFINTYCGPQNDKTAGALLGIWDGIVVHRAWRSDRLLEPATLIELALCVCFDIFFRGSALRAFALALGAVLGVLLADALPALWEDAGAAGMTLRSMKIVDDFDSSVVLSEFSEDVTVVYEEYSRTTTTSAWIAAQRTKQREKEREKAKEKEKEKEKARTQRQSISVTADRRRSRRDSVSVARQPEVSVSPEPLPLPPPAASLFSAINIDVQPPSRSSRVSSPTIKAEEITREVETSRVSQSTRSHSRANSSRAAFTPASISPPERSTRRGSSVAAGPEIITPIAALPPFAEFRSRGMPLPKTGRSAASARTTERFAESYMRMVGGSVEVPRLPEKFESTTPRMNMNTNNSLGHTLTESVHRSTTSRAASRSRSRPASPKPELVINYSNDMTTITIPPAAEAGMSVRITSHVDEEHQQSPEDGMLREEAPHDASVVDSEEGDPAAFIPPRLGSVLSEFDEYPAMNEPETYSIRSRSAYRRSRQPSAAGENREWRNSFAQSTGFEEERRAAAERAESVFVSGNRRVSSGFQAAEFEDEAKAIIDESVTIESRTPPRSYHPSPIPSPIPSPNRSRGRSRESRRPRRDTNTLELDVQEEVVVTSAFVEEVDERSERPYSPIPVPSRHYAPSNVRSHAASRAGVEDRHEGPSSIPLDQTRPADPSFVFSPTSEESVLSGGPKASVFLRAQQLRQEARDVEAGCAVLRAQRRQAQAVGDHARAFALGFEIEDMEESAKKLHRKAERRFYLANNTEHSAERIDVHHLKVLEAVRQTEKALYALQQRGGKELQVIVGRGKHSVGGVPVLKNAIMDKMTKKHHLDVKVDKSNPGLIHVLLA
ncbi:hypothetical protein M0805_005692 [Coniferiporia weirii]|nr:hypothetical protein M0805_005692 [Coniferiporia weirii]